MSINKNPSKVSSNQVLQRAFDDDTKSLRILSSGGKLVPEEYNTLELSYTGDDLTQVVYKNDTTVIATLTLGYTGGKLTSVVRS